MFGFVLFVLFCLILFVDCLRKLFAGCCLVFMILIVCCLGLFCLCYFVCCFGCSRCCVFGLDWLCLLFWLYCGCCFGVSRHSVLLVAWICCFVCLVLALDVVLFSLLLFVALVCCLVFGFCA